MRNLDEIKKTLIGFFPKETLQDTTWEYDFKFNFDKDINVIAYATNFTPHTIQNAIKNGADLLITHHDSWPFMAKQREFCEKLRNKGKLNHCFFHTPLDHVEFGTNGALIDAIGGKNKKSTCLARRINIGYACDVTPQTLNDLVKKVNKAINEKTRVFVNNNDLVKKVLVVTGGLGSEPTKRIDCALEENCDTFITGEYKLSLQQYAEFNNVNLIVGSHTNTEFLGVENLVKKLHSIPQFQGIKTFAIKEPNY
jgi:putative NIF3 family GTP cyclohydrolase 1 type 2